MRSGICTSFHGSLSSCTGFFELLAFAFFAGRSTTEGCSTFCLLRALMAAILGGKPFFSSDAAIVM